MLRRASLRRSFGRNARLYTWSLFEISDRTHEVRDCFQIGGLHDRCRVLFGSAGCEPFQVQDVVSEGRKVAFIFRRRRRLRPGRSGRRLFDRLLALAAASFAGRFASAFRRRRRIGGIALRRLASDFAGLAGTSGPASPVASVVASTG